MSVGLMAARRNGNLLRAVLPLAAVAAALALATLAIYNAEGGRLTIDVGSQQASPQLIYFGAEYRPADPSRWIIPIWAVGGAFFALIALTFVGLGQAMGRAFDAIPDRIAAYTLDVLGSLCGIAAFAALSYLGTSPLAWFLPVVLLTLYLVGWTRRQAFAAAALIVLAALGAAGTFEKALISWSPYYKVAYQPTAGAIITNNIAHQYMLDISRHGPAYLMPHVLNRDAGGKPFADVLVIGAGSGNDVAAALRSGARRVDAVEIDPRIIQIGREAHPDRPYADPKVSAHLDDGRSFMRNTGRRYDLAVYAVVDSLVLHSGYSSLRLENFLFTREAFEDVKKVLKPDGVFVMYNFYRQGWVVSRLAAMAEQVFGSRPIVISAPYQERIRPGDRADHITFLMVAPDAGRLEGIRVAFEQRGSLWMNADAKLNDAINGFRPAAPDRNGQWARIAPAQVELTGEELLPSDDWPQLYLRDKAIPWAPIGQGMLTIAVLSLAIVLVFAPVRRVRPNPQMFFLGAGFMLLETKGVVHMALLFGGTWVVNSIVFAAILLMILAANLYVLQARPRRLAPYYALLIAALLANALMPMSVFLSLAPWARIAASCAVVFLPIFFAGVIFAAAFRDSRRPDVDFGSNVAGIVLGGLSEQLSLVVGFNYLLLVAVAYYLLSLLPSRMAKS
jgi:SAM-dependent methyltransferase